MNSKIEFRSTQDNTWVMRITQDKRIEVNEDVEVTEAAKIVLASMQNLLSQQRTWVGLTNEEIHKLWIDGDINISEAPYSVIAHEVEKKLKEKNT